MGMKHRHLNVPGEDKVGVHYCYTCDGPFYRGRVVGVVGGSDSAALAALMLRDYASKVYVIYRRDKLRAEPISSKKVYNDEKMEVIHNANVVEVLGEGRINAVKLDNGNTLELNGLFIEIGQVPLNVFAKNIGVEVDERGFIKVGKDHSTNVVGFFAAGDITDASNLKQLITSAAEGSKAAQGAYRYLK